ncbi:MAG: tail-specific protease, partial [Xanthomonadales bacterium]|nr:tail-specific protease [Xanthomonadales bacterium]
MNRFMFVMALLLTTCVAQASVCPKPAASDIVDTSKPVQPLKPNADQSEAATLTANLMTRYHYDAVPLDDAMSKKIFKGYIDSLDSQKMFFTQADIDSFNAARTTLDDAIWNGDLTVPFHIFNVYVKRLVARTAYAQKLLAKGFDFKQDESYHYDRSKAEWAKDEAALNDLWRKRVKNDWLRLELADKKDAAIKTTLDKRYTMYLQRVR